MRAPTNARPTPLRTALAAGALALSLGSCSSGQPETTAAAPEAPAPAAPAAPAPDPADAPLPAPAPPGKVRGVKQLAEVVSPFSRIRVRQEGTRRTLLFVRKRGDEMVQTIIDLTAPDTPTLAYAHGMASPFLVVDDPRRLLMIGLGGGTLVRFLRARAPQATLDVVEIDPEVVRLAAEWFGIVPGPRLNIVTDDGARFIAESRESYDIIWLDAFLEPGGPDTDVAGVPRRLRQIEWLEQVRARLRPGGVAAFNIHHLFGYDEHVDAIASVFPRVYLLTPTDSNERIVLALERDEPLALDALKARAAAFDAEGRWGVPLAALAASATPWRTPQP